MFQVITTSNEENVQLNRPLQASSLVLHRVDIRFSGANSKHVARVSLPFINDHNVSSDVTDSIHVQLDNLAGAGWSSCEFAGGAVYSDVNVPEAFTVRVVDEDGILLANCVRVICTFSYQE